MELYYYNNTPTSFFKKKLYYTILAAHAIFKYGENNGFDEGFISLKDQRHYNEIR